MTERPAVEGGWRSIRTAPMNEPVIIIADEHVAYAAQEPTDYGSTYWVTHHEEAIEWQPTHWMPLPDTALAMHKQQVVTPDVVERAGVAVAAVLDELNEEARRGDFAAMEVDDPAFRKMCSERLARAALAALPPIARQNEENTDG